MPLVKIWAYTGKSDGYRRAILDSTCKALEEALMIPECNVIITLNEMEPSHFKSIRGATENFTMIEVTLFQGRDTATKKRLYQALARNLAMAPGIGGSDVVIVIRESPKENWSVRDGLPASETGVGFIKDR